MTDPPTFICPTHGEVPRNEVGYDSQPPYPPYHAIECGEFVSVVQAGDVSRGE